MGARTRFALAAALALLVAAGLALLANAVFAAEADLRATDARLAAPGAPAGTPAPARGLRARLADAILGVADDRSFRTAVGLIHASRVPGTPVKVVLARHGQAVVILNGLARAEDEDRERRSRAANLIGVLTFEDAALDRRSARRYLEISLDAFERAVRLDPENEEAKFNLELALTLDRERRSARGGGETGRQGAKSGGSSPAGSGY